MKREENKKNIIDVTRIVRYALENALCVCVCTAFTIFNGYKTHPRSDLIYEKNEKNATPQRRRRKQKKTVQNTKQANKQHRKKNIYGKNERHRRQRKNTQSEILLH